MRRRYILQRLFDLRFFENFAAESLHFPLKAPVVQKDRFTKIFQVRFITIENCANLRFQILIVSSTAIDFRRFDNLIGMLSLQQIDKKIT